MRTRVLSEKRSTSNPHIKSSSMHAPPKLVALPTAGLCVILQRGNILCLALVEPCSFFFLRTLPTSGRPWSCCYATPSRADSGLPARQKSPGTYGSHACTRKTVIALIFIRHLYSREQPLLYSHNAWRTTSPPIGHTELANAQLCKPNTSTKQHRDNGLHTGTPYFVNIALKTLGEDIPPEEPRGGRLVNASGYCEFKRIL